MISSWPKVKRFLQHCKLLLFCLLGIVVGLVIGILLNTYSVSPSVTMWLGIPGELFMNLLKMAVVPLLISNVITKAASLDGNVQGKLASMALLYAVITNVIGSFTSVAFYLIIQPGKMIAQNHSAEGRVAIGSLNTHDVGISDILADFIRNLVPSNLLEAYMFSVYSKYANVSTNGDDDTFVMKRSLEKSSGTNLLGLVVMSILFGVTARRVGEAAKPFLDLFESLSLITVRLLNYIIWLLPIGVCSLVIVSIANIENASSVLASMAWFSLAVSLSVFAHQCITLPIVYLLLVRQNPFKLFLYIRTAWITAFGTTSGLVAVPSLYDCLDKLRVLSGVSRCVIPLIVNCNANGSAAFICLATLFVAQLAGVAFNASELFIIAIMSSIGVMALPSIPSASLVTVTLLLSSFQKPTAFVSLLFAAEFILDRFRTTTNVVSHGVCASVVNALLSTKLRKQIETPLDLNVEEISLKESNYQMS